MSEPSSLVPVCQLVIMLHDLIHTFYCDNFISFLFQQLTKLVQVRVHHLKIGSLLLARPCVLISKNLDLLCLSFFTARRYAERGLGNRNYVRTSVQQMRALRQNEKKTFFNI